MTIPLDLCKFHEETTREKNKEKVVILWWFNSSVCKFLFKINGKKNTCKSKFVV
jgi:hypothetical protein